MIVAPATVVPPVWRTPVVVYAKGTKGIFIYIVERLREAAAS